MTYLLDVAKVFTLTLAACAFAPGARAQDKPAAELPPNLGDILRDDELSEFEKTHRFLIVFAPSKVEERYQDQKARLDKEEKGLRQRDTVVVSSFPFQGGEAGDQVISMKDSTGLRERYEIGAADFVVLLVGKDGRVAFRLTKPTPVDQIFGRIDEPEKAKAKNGE